MSYRKVNLVNGAYYHIYNRSVMGMPIFRRNSEYEIFLESARYYLQFNPPVRFSFYRINRDKYVLDFRKKLSTIISFCIMPNHFHFLLRQDAEEGIKKYIQKLTNSYSHYFAKKNNYRGHVFERNFQAVLVEDDEQLIHLSRYIHLNPVTAYLVENPLEYRYSSYSVYLNKSKSDLTDPRPIMDLFKTAKKYETFTMDQKDYQRTLNANRHLFLE